MVLTGRESSFTAPAVATTAMREGGIILVLMGVLRMGSMIKFIPYTITTGFGIQPLLRGHPGSQGQGDGQGQGDDGHDHPGNQKYISRLGAV